MNTVPVLYFRGGRPRIGSLVVPEGWTPGDAMRACLNAGVDYVVIPPGSYLADDAGNVAELQLQLPIIFSFLSTVETP